MERWRDARGQATSEYVALVALVAVVLALAAGLTAGGIGGELLAGMQRGLCRLTGSACARPSTAADVLAPCPLERSTTGESIEGAFELVKLGGRATLTAVRRSDGRVTVTLSDGTSAGAEAGVGFRLALGSRLAGELTASVEAEVASGRSWTLPSDAAARAFVDRYGSKATIGGRVVDVVRSGCSILCDAIGWRPHAELPPPDERFVSHGGAAKLTASLAPASLRASGGALLGASLRRDGSSTWLLQLDTAALAELALGAAKLGAGWQRQAVVAYTLDARQRPTRLAVRTVSIADGSVAARGGRGSATAGIEAGGASVSELEASLDLHDPRNGAAAAAFVSALGDPLALPSLRRRAAAVRMRIADDGIVDRRTYALDSSAFELGAKLSRVVQVGGSFARTHRGMRLLSAETRLPGLPFLPRDDCRAPVPSA